MRDNLSRPPAGPRQGRAGRPTGSRCWVFLAALLFAVLATEARPGPGLVAGMAAGLMVVGMVAGGAEARRVKAGARCDAEGQASAFTLSVGDETVVLSPGISWHQVDHFKWVTRGLIEEPQSFHVFPDGAIEINGEKLALADREGLAKLELEINKRFTVPVVHRPPPGSTGSQSAAAAGRAASPDKIQFKVKLDHLGHLMIACIRGAERVETGLRGISGLVQNGLMLKPQNVHLDPLMRAIEIDGVRFECNEAGARQMEAALNARYAPRLQDDKETAIEIRENPASPTGFDIHFVTVCAGARLDVKGHLSQEHLDLLQDAAKCELLRPGIILRLSPPDLLIRRRRSDGGEDKIPELPDIHYRRVTAMQLQQMLNHPSIRRSGGTAGPTTAPAAERPAAQIAELRVVRNPQNKFVLWLECVAVQGGTREGRAFTHHNIAELQHQGVFLPHLDVCLSVDGRTLSILNQQTRKEDTLPLDSHSADEDLVQAGRLLTAALKPPAPEVLEPARRSPEAGNAPVAGPRDSEQPARESAHEPAAPTPASPSPLLESAAVGKAATGAAPRAVETPRSAAPAGPPPEPALARWFCETDPVRINVEIFRRLGPRFGVPVQDVRLSMPMVFENRRFEIISFSHEAIDNILELRGAEFFGFYLSHINERKVLLLYARNGLHLEWGPDRCMLQTSVTAEPSEYTGHALRGMAQDADSHFVFVVDPAFKDWVKPHEGPYAEAFVHFATVAELAAAPDDYTLVWPERPRAGAETSGA